MHRDEINEIWYVEKTIRSFDHDQIEEKQDQKPGEIMELINFQSNLIHELKREIQGLKN